MEDISNSNNEKYIKICKNFDALFKTGISSDYANRDKIINLLRFETTKTTDDNRTSLKEYTLKMKADQKDIYYIFGSVKELIMNNPNLEYFIKNELEVILLLDPIDVFCIPHIGTYEGKNLVSIEKADVDLINKDDKKQDNITNSEPFINYMKEVLKDKAADVILSQRLVTSPVTLVISKDGIDSQMEKMMHIINKNYQASMKILEVNIEHQLIQNLIAIHNNNPQSDKLNNAILQLFDGAMLIEGQIKDTNEFVKRMVSFMTDATHTN